MTKKRMKKNENRKTLQKFKKKLKVKIIQILFGK